MTSDGGYAVSEEPRTPKQEGQRAVLAGLLAPLLGIALMVIVSVAVDVLIGVIVGAVAVIVLVPIAHCLLHRRRGRDS